MKSEAPSVQLIGLSAWGQEIIIERKNKNADSLIGLLLLAIK